MTDRNRQTAFIGALYTIGAGLLSLSLAIAAGIWNASAWVTKFNTEHQQIFRTQEQTLQTIREKCK